MIRPRPSCSGTRGARGADNEVAFGAPGVAQAANAENAQLQATIARLDRELSEEMEHPDEAQRDSQLKVRRNAHVARARTHDAPVSPSRYVTPRLSSRKCARIGS